MRNHMRRAAIKCAPCRRHAIEQYLTADQLCRLFLRQVMALPQAAQGFCAKKVLFPRNTRIGSKRYQ